MKRFLIGVTAIVFIATLVLRLQGQGSRQSSRRAAAQLATQSANQPTSDPAAEPVTQSVTHADDAWLPPPIYPDVLARWDRGNAADALTVLEAQLRGPDKNGVDAADAIEAQLLRARLLSAAGEHKRSAELWERIRDRESALSRVTLRSAAENHVRAGNLARAEQLLAAQPTRTHGDLVAMIAAAYRASGQFDQAIPLYRKVSADAPSGAVADEAALGLASSLDQSGDREAALSLLRNLRLRFRQPATFARAHAQLLRIAAAFNRDVQPYTEREYRTLTERLRDLSAYQDALGVLDEWKKVYPGSASEVDALVVDTLYRARSNEQARAGATAFLTEHPDSPQVPEIRVLLYRLDVREGRTDGVRSRGEALWTGKVAGVSLEDRLSLGRLLAAYLVSVGRVAEGLDVYERLHRATTSRELRIDVLWRSAVATVRAGQLDRAGSMLRALRQMKPGPDTSQVADYWSAVIAERQHRRDDAIAMFTALARRTPYDYYGIRARERLAALGAPLPLPAAGISFPSLSLRDATRADSDYRGAILLARAGLKTEAAQMARDLAARMRTDAALALLAARASEAAGDHRQAVRLIESRFATFLVQPSTGRPDDLLLLAYPQAFWTQVREAAESTHVDPLLLLSLARQESRFDPTVRSLVGAVGLFQIMPYRADELGPRLGIDVADRSALLQPAVSAAFAAQLIGGLMKRFNNQAVAVMASYNADENRVADWWNSARSVTEDLFVDTIPYTETRTYVRTVYANYVMYRQLYGDAPVGNLQRARPTSPERSGSQPAQ